MPLLAILDKDGVLTEYREVTKKNHKTKAGQVAVPDECDLAIGRYRWDGETFLPRHQDTDSAFSETTVHAIALGFASLHNAGHDLHAETVNWLREYERSFDNKRPQRVKLTR